MSSESIEDYLRQLQPDDRVIDVGDTVRRGMYGTVYLNDSGSICVMWDDGMGTSATWGTRRLGDEYKEII